MSHDAHPAGRRRKRAWSRHTGRRRWVTYSGYITAVAGLACLVVHLFAGWRLVRIDAMLPTYLWIVTVLLFVVGSVVVLANEGLRRLEGSEEVAFGQVVSKPLATEECDGKSGDVGRGGERSDGQGSPVVAGRRDKVDG